MCRNPAVSLQPKPANNKKKQMKLLKLLPFALLTLTFVACGDDEKEEKPIVEFVSPTGTYVTTVFGVTYATDEVTVTAKFQKGKKSLTLVVDEVTGSPARGEIPAQMMTDLTIENIPLVVSETGNYTFDVDPANGYGTMGGDVSTFKRCHIRGQLTGKDLTFTMEYKFTDSDREPLLTSTYQGTYNVQE